MSETQNIEIWRSCLSLIRTRMKEDAFATWFKPIRPVDYVNQTMILEVPNDYFREYLEANLADKINEALKEVTGHPVRIKVNVPQERTVSEISVQTRKAKEKAYAKSFDSHLNPDYTFSTFVEGDCNKIGRSAGIAISENPGYNAYNPLFIYGGPGLGKTHLAQAIGASVKKNHPDRLVLYVSANMFMTQYVHAVQNNKTTEFTSFYQTVDVLIIDDVQEFAGKPGTQSAFFHIFNHLQQTGKQLILTSDRPPVELKGLEERLLSRFKWGLSVELSKPEYMTRFDILKSKCVKENMNIGEDTLKHLAQKIEGTIRDLEGVLKSIYAYAKFSSEKLSVALVDKIIGQFIETAPSKEITVKLIVDSVCHYFDITKELLNSKTKKREIVQARQIAMYLSHQMTKNSLSVIGLQIGKRNHATVIHACNTVDDLMNSDMTFKQYVTEIKASLMTC